ncbi:MAG TPA: hypothetical protein VH640_02655 [Bryobacteraceae bacterium]|jgi:xanthine/uracil/vitamin C permease (AzgA family)
MSFRQRLEQYFEFKELGTNWRTEILAGLTTFWPAVKAAQLDPVAARRYE